ncbi:MAG: archaellin/type IV pilin N-terminal domain-containing protein [Ignisphaera sp.]
MRSLYRGIEPIIAVVILVAVTLVIAIGVIGWIMGWWGTLGATEVLQTFPDSKIIISSAAGGGGQCYLVLHIQNKGTADAAINKIEVAGTSITRFTSPSNCPGTVDVSGNLLVLKPGPDTEIYIGPINLENVYPSASYSVAIYTKTGNRYPVTVQAITQNVEQDVCTVAPS